MIFPGSVRNTLLALVFTVLLPAAGIIVYSGMEDERRKEAAILEDGRELVHAIAFRKESMMENISAMLLALGRFDEIARGDLPATRAIFRDVIQQTPFYTNLALTDQEGAILTSALPAERTSPLDHFDIAMARKLNRLFIGEAYFDEGTGPGHLRFAYPVRDGNGRPATMIIGGLRTDKYALTSHMADLPEGAVLSQLDGKGTALLSFPEQNSSPEDQAVARQLLRDQKEPEGMFTLPLASGASQTILYRHLYLPDSRDPYLTVTLSLPEESVAAAGKAELFRNLGLLFLAVCAALFLVVALGAKVISPPLLAVLETARRLRRGDYSARTDMPELQGEFGTLARSFNAMAEAIETRDRERIQAKKMSDANNAAKSEFLASMSHAIRTPMNSVIGIAYLLMKAGLDTRQRGYVSRIYTAANTLLGIINDIQDFSNIEAGRFTIESVPFRLSETFDNIMTLHSHKAEERNLALILDIEEGVPDALQGDPLRLTQIITNLVSNALKFTESGGITIRCVRGEEPCTEQQAAPDAERIRLVFSVEDTGIGMTKEQVVSLFDAYFQADDSISRKYGGTGLGLAISRRLVQLMGGELEAHSLLGSGTRMFFSACFGIQAQAAPSQDVLAPRTDEAKTGLPAPSSRDDAFAGSGPGMLTALHVLLVEDNPVNQEIAATLLRDAGARVSLTSNGAEALDLLTGDYPVPPVDLVLMDVQMPIMDGYEATNRIRAMERFKNLPIIAMTAHALHEERERCLRAGMNDHISKPLEIDKFFATIARCLNLDRYPGGQKSL